MKQSQRHLTRAAAVAAAAALAAAWLWAAPRSGDAPGAALQPAALQSAAVVSSGKGDTTAFDGRVEAVRQTVLAAQVSGSVVALDVKAGDTVKAGQVLVRLDARAAEQSAAAGAAQVRSARAALDAAESDFARQKLLRDKNYISQAAFERAEAQYKTAQADASAQLANAGAARTQSDFYVIRAPYAGVVSDVGVVLGDMAMPGRALVTLYDPAALRVTAAIPESVAARMAPDARVTAEVPGLAVTRYVPQRVQLLPAVDPATHTRELRMELVADVKGLAPGMFARALLPAPADAASGRLFVPARAVVRRAELTAVYVLGADGKPLLRQVRTGRVEGDLVEILSGVSAGERVALDPQAAAVAR